ncbi:MAG: 2-ketoisovalerate ferredoxin oxidoreductase [Latescibacteria bacterium DG_63]|uniref:2-ketoisovalerate ferredoxin oxidoreductase n=2 Tax=Bacteria division TA06 TaxID=1156500 RepID=A0A0S8JM10_UNCT6|nr:MAG: 2-ketoisovalerate ferredoxin oxidoreductase [Latescibacteria bacterium DG_63]KPK69530.1 MAG: 2-ketoisovalerate ferredoxin oxidoreductase [candidate division TA06 bacterium SM23_40]KPL10783.1 MAG: 2-ketoisovalerate ferredoxin oxidoreductase [candidate division TA06 bacterium SM1_40]
MARELIKGNDALVKGAILAGCRSYFGYPITPASEIAEAAARFMPLVGGTFIQAESEVAAINMVYGAASAGQRTMTASSSPGFSLKQEGISYCAGSELPCVIANIVRGGPGLGNIAPEQGDYFQTVKGGGHGNYRVIVFAPNSAQEMCDFSMLAFDLADKYRNPVLIMSDGFTGQMMEPVDFPEPKPVPERDESWAVCGDADTRPNLISSIYLEPEELEAHIKKLKAKYDEMQRTEVRYEEYEADDAEIMLIGFGIVSRVLRSVVDRAREKGLKVGLLRPITLWPFPSKRIAQRAKQVETFLVVELSTGQMVEDVQLAVMNEAPVRLYWRAGGVVPTAEEILGEIEKMIEG